MNDIVHPDKITKYLLNPAHPSGAAKAVSFAAKGFSAAHPQVFADSLKNHPVQAVLTSATGDAEVSTWSTSARSRSPAARGPVSAAFGSRQRIATVPA